MITARALANASGAWTASVAETVLRLHDGADASDATVNTTSPIVVTAHDLGEAAGATLMKPIFDVADVGRLAILTEPGGAGVGWITPAQR